MSLTGSHEERRAVVDLENYKSGIATRRPTSLQDAARGTRAFPGSLSSLHEVATQAATMRGSSGFFVMRYGTQT
jgi:hypothetical protein